MDDFTKLKRERAVVRAALTTTIRKAEGFLSSESTETTDGVLPGFVNLIQKKLDALDDLDRQISHTIDETELEKEVAETTQYQESAFILLSRISTALAPKISQSSGVPSIAESVKCDSHSGHNVKLPKLSIPPFDGDPLNFQEFIENFTASVDSNEQLSGQEKFLYLRSLLKGTALKSIQGAMNEANYDSALKIIKERFGDQKLLVASHVDTLMKLKPVLEAKNSVKMRALYDQIATSVRNLKSLGIDSASYGPIIIPCILSKLPEEFRLEVTKRVTLSDWNFDHILSAMNDEISIREACSFVSGVSKKPDSTKSEQPRTNSLLHTSAKKRDTFCVYCCSHEHKPWECNVVTEVDQRKNHLHANKLCLNCLTSGHKSSACKSRFSCYSCGGRHHSSICPKISSASASVGTQVSTGHMGEKDTPATSECVLLKTAKGKFCNPNNDRSMQGRILLDEGSQKSYITQQACDKLGLKPVSHHDLVINGACAQSTVLKSCKVVQFVIVTHSGQRLIIKASVLNEICHPLTSQPIYSAVKNYAHLKNLHFSDFHGDSVQLPIDCLIGADYALDLLTGRRVECPTRGPTAFETKLGWVLTGPLPLFDTNSVQNSYPMSTHSLKCCEVSTTSSVSDLNEKVSEMWKLENIGIVPDELCVYDNFSRNIAYNEEGKFYSVNLPWKDPRPVLPDNYLVSLKRLHGNLKKLRKTPDVLTNYHSVIENQLQQDVIEKCTAGKISDSSFPTHYLPHRGVLKEDNVSSKLRIVFDASCRASKSQPSLNDGLYKGPSMNFDSISNVCCAFSV